MQISVAKSISAPASEQISSKWRRVLRALLSGRSYNRFEAERELHDHCIHTTASNLQRKGLTILRREESVPGYQGSPTRVMRYRLCESSRTLAKELLGLAAH